MYHLWENLLYCTTYQKKLHKIIIIEVNIQE